MKDSASKKIIDELNTMIKVVMYLMILAIVFRVTGTTFFGIDFLNLTLAVILIILAASQIATIKWIIKKLESIFKV